MAKTQQIPKTVLNIFYRHGTKVGIGTLHEYEELDATMSKAIASGESVRVDAVNPDESIEADHITIVPDDIIFYSIRIPRVVSNLITEVPAGLSLDKTVQ